MIFIVLYGEADSRTLLRGSVLEVQILSLEVQIVQLKIRNRAYYHQHLVVIRPTTAQRCM
jgi:hypothetical protein